MELDALRGRVALTLRFMGDAEDLGAFGEMLAAKVESAFSKDDLRAMRLIVREVDSLAIALPPHQREGLEAVLKSRLGVDKDAERAVLRDRVAVILRRGTIASERERRKLEDYLELLEATGGDVMEMGAVRQLLQR